VDTGNFAKTAAAFSGLRVSNFDAYSTPMQKRRWIHPIGNLETINLNDGTSYREYAFTIYQKSQQEWDRYRHLRRGDVLRVEAKRRFNRTPRFREIHLAELPGIPNPFAALGIYNRARIDETFTAKNDRSFLDMAQHLGMQSAFEETGGANRERRERKLAACHVNWWNPQRAWRGRHEAVDTALQL